MRRFFQIAFPTLIILALIGFITSIINDPLQVLRSILIFAGIAAAIFFIYRFYMSRKYGVPIFHSNEGPTRAQLKKAKRTSTVRSAGPVNHSKLKPATTKQMKRNQKPFKKVASRRSGPQLTVIEGKKNKFKSKKKNRASF
ncbi:SA1362 family protein [Alkalicoccobacillus murimartini]|uniref:Energy-coupling factor transporter transmembrane protein EcfT n=1 Tax=Alkalicoccobacillus murimartini TaxID=171685 RepID=A0ABT9YNB2_9BACI|nr:SA1362 family protein [Alkalicoccobacillus murimartini]MDQ0208981.1 energy-coupling factor transporter transmembrane protein EcfT [Alkalicoccobacillus murimartini]